MALEDIMTVSAPSGEHLTGNAAAVLHEVAEMLVTLAERGETGIIDLGGIPLSGADKDWLSARLGRGEIEISLDLNGRSEVFETAFHGVWWLVHRNEKDVLTGEFIEVSRVPGLVPAHPDDIREAADKLGFLIGDFLKT